MQRHWDNVLVMRGKSSISVPLCKLKKRKGIITPFKQIKFYKMKKIIGILGITLIIAVSFFNMSSVVDVNQNVNLASIIQNASADSEATYDWEDKYEEEFLYSEPRYSGGRWCTYVATHHVVECYGWGNVICTPVDEFLNEDPYCL